MKRKNHHSGGRHVRCRESALPGHLFKKTVVRRFADGLESGQWRAAGASLIEADAYAKVVTKGRLDR